MITQFFKVEAGQTPVAKITLNQRMGDKDEYRIDIETAPPPPTLADEEMTAEYAAGVRAAFPGITDAGVASFWHARHLPTD